MYARLTLFTIGPGMQAKAEEIAAEMIPQVETHKGFKSINFLADDEAGEYGAFILWDTKEDGEAAKEALLPVLQSKLAGIAKGPPTVKLFEVIASQS